MRPIFLIQNVKKGVLTVDQEELLYDINGGKINLTGIAVKSTTITADQSWITDILSQQLSTNINSGPFSIRVVVGDTIMPRSGIITIADNTTTIYVLVNQEREDI